VEKKKYGSFKYKKECGHLVRMSLFSISIRSGTKNTSFESYDIQIKIKKILPIAELSISLFEITQSLFALERTFILGAMALLETKSGVQ